MRFLTNFRSKRPLNEQILLITSCLIIFTSGAYAADKIIWAGFSFTGDYSENQERYPYAAELATQTTENGMPVLDYALNETKKKYYQRREKLIDTQRDIDSGRSIALAFGLSQESIEEVGWKSEKLYIYRVLSQVMIFDFKEMLLIANFPAMLQLQEIDANIRDKEAHRKVFRQIYLNTNNTERSIFYEWIMRLNSVEIKESYPFYLKVSSLDLDSNLLKQLPEGTNANTYKSGVVQLFESILSKEQKVSMIPFTKGQSVGSKMSLRFNDTKVLELKLPEPDYVFDIKLHEFKYLAKKSGGSIKHAFGSFATFDLSLPVSGKHYFEQRFKKVNFAAFSAQDNVNVDVWNGQQTALRGLFVGFAQQISQKDAKALSQMVKEPQKVAKQLICVEEIIAKCR